MIAATGLTGLALVATLVARRGIAGAARRATVARRLLLLYSLVAALLFLRLVQPLWPAWPVTAAMMMTAVWLPFATLRLAEELVRRHAPRIVKLAALGGSLLLTLLPLTLGLIWTDQAVAALAMFQAMMILCVLVLLLRNRRDVTPMETQAADLFALALLLAIPLILSDFQLFFPALSVRGGVFAALILVLATSRLTTGHGRPIWLLVDLLLMLAGAGFTLLVMPGLAVALPAAACVGAMVALALLIERFTGLKDSGLVRALSRLSPDAQRRDILSVHPLLSSGYLVEASQLDDMPGETLRHLASHPMLSAAALPDDLLEAEAGRDLLDRYAASHILRLSIDPPRFLAVAAGDLSGTRIDDELAIVVRLLERLP
ncbi:hypothetical protein [Sphingobium sp. WCS2017Hpa-17]|uniref:hypothetical protein n=1 Tax=Sphingobium sp. WCS2017Hpa-17 TaxID=3073638 RepID=UPI002889CF05|nr:hypothetical protein [Sphingobium sp. WCS2017Hpa-17]